MLPQAVSHEEVKKLLREQWVVEIAEPTFDLNIKESKNRGYVKSSVSRHPHYDLFRGTHNIWYS
jgi:hypothetical protein